MTDGAESALLPREEQALDRLTAECRATSRPLSTLLPDLPAGSEEDFREYGDDLEVKHRCPRCGYSWS